MKKNSLKRILKTFLVLFIAIVLVTGLMPNRLIADEQEPKDELYFIVEKIWQNDTDKEGNTIRPESININIIGRADGATVSTKPDTLTGPDWKKAYRLPAKTNDDKDITYYVTEEQLEKYATSYSDQDGRIKGIVVENIDEREEVDTFVINKSGFASAPRGNVFINTELMLADAEEIKNGQLASDFVYNESTTVYGDPTNSGRDTNTGPRISYKGELAKGENNIPGKIELTWKGKAIDDMGGELYDVKLTVSNITIYTLSAMDKSVAILANQDNYLHMQAYVSEFTDGDITKNLVGVGADLTFEISKNGTPAEGFTQVYITDLDVSDYVKYYEETGVYDDQWYGVGQQYSEAVELIDGVASDIYLSGTDTVLQTNEPSNSKYAAAYETNWNSSPLTSLEFLATASSYSYRWTGSDCGTTIVVKSTSDPAEEDEYTNTIYNTAAQYVVEYYYQKIDAEKGAYYDRDNPDATSSATILKPNTDVEVTETDKTPAKKGYILDESEDADWKGTVLSAHGKDNPLELKVYFLRKFTVTYHDNVDDTVFEKEVNPGLDYGDNTPAFDRDPSTVEKDGLDPIRPGYEFLGWTKTAEETDPTKFMTTSEVAAIIVKDDADYWAHWKPSTTTYKVEYYYQVDGNYPSKPDYTSGLRTGITEQTVSITESDKVPQKSDYSLSSKMNSEWTGVVKGDGSLVLKVYFKEKPRSAVSYYSIPVTGVK